jgi:DNA polymerase III epsilon subunit-like protein
MSVICFVDTETTSLRPDRRAWEIGIIRRADGADTELHWFVDAADLDLGNADPMSLKIGRFHERHPQASALAADWRSLPDEATVMDRVERLTRGAHLVGAVVSFDAEVLGQRMRANRICPSWHYHLIDVEALAVGFLHGKRGTCQQPLAMQPGFEAPGVPWKSDDLAAALGVTISDEDRHTALGDARWARAIYDTVTGGAA